MEAVILEERPDVGVTIVNGKAYMTDAKGALVPEQLVKPQHKLEDQTVRKIVAYARGLSAQIGRFRGHAVRIAGIRASSTSGFSGALRNWRLAAAKRIGG